MSDNKQEPKLTSIDRLAETIIDVFQPSLASSVTVLGIIAANVVFLFTLPALLECMLILDGVLAFAAVRRKRWIAAVALTAWFVFVVWLLGHSG